MSVLDWFNKPTKRIARRYKQRRFDAGVSNTLVAWFQGFVSSINSDLKSDMATMRSRARDMAQNEPMARKYLRLLAANVIGSRGIVLQSLIFTDRRLPNGEMEPDKAAREAVEAAWKKFNQVGFMDATGMQSGKAFCATVLKTCARDGFAILQEDTRADNEFGYALTHLDGTRLATDLNKDTDQKGNTVIMGVEVDTKGRRIAYHFYKNPFGSDKAARSETQRIAADKIIYLADFDFPEQIHGYSWLHAAMTRMRTLKKYQEAALTASAVGALKMGFYTQDPDVGLDGNPSIADSEDPQGPIQNAEAAHFELLEPGMDFKAFDPDYPHQMHESFVKTSKRDISSGLDVSYHSLANDLEGVNFSSIRSGTLEEREQYKMVQEWFIDHLMERMFDKFIRIALLKGAIKHPGTGTALPAAKADKFANHKFIGRRWDWVDPLKDEQANETALKNALDSPYRILTQKGLDPDEVLDDLRRFQEAAKAKGIDPAYITGVMQAQQQPQNNGGESGED